MNIGIDIGGSHIGIGVVSPDGKILKKVEEKITYIEKNNIKEFLVNTIVTILKKWEDEEFGKIEKIGIGIPGIVKDDIVKYSVNLGLKNFDLKKSYKRILNMRKFI